MPSLPDVPGVLYWCLDDDGEIIYIGTTCDLRERLSAHRHRSHWFGEVARVGTYAFDSLAVAREREKDAIARVRPCYNVQHKNAHRHWMPTSRRPPQAG